MINFRIEIFLWSKTTTLLDSHKQMNENENFPNYVIEYYPFQPNAGPSRNAQQLALLNSRYQEYKSAALAQRDSGSREEALRLLKYVKDLKGMIEIAQNGLPIDESTIPPSLGPTEASGPSDSLKTYKPSKASEGDDSTFDLIEEQLTKQIELCETNAVVSVKLHAQTLHSYFLWSHCDTGS